MKLIPVLLARDLGPSGLTELALIFYFNIRGKLSIKKRCGKKLL